MQPHCRCPPRGCYCCCRHWHVCHLEHTSRAAATGMPPPPTSVHSCRANSVSATTLSVSWPNQAAFQVGTGRCPSCKGQKHACFSWKVEFHGTRPLAKREGTPEACQRTQVLHGVSRRPTLNVQRPPTTRTLQHLPTQAATILCAG